MAVYENMESQTALNSFDELTNVELVVIPSGHDNNKLYAKTRAEHIEGVLPVSKGGSGLSTLSGSKLLASSYDGNFFEEVDIDINKIACIEDTITNNRDTWSSDMIDKEIDRRIDKATENVVYYENEDGDSLFDLVTASNILTAEGITIEEALTNLKTNIGTVVRTYHVSVPSNTRWINTSNQYTIELSVPGIKATDNPIVNIQTLQTTASGIEAEYYAYSCISMVTTKDDAIILTCFEECPATDIQLHLICY